jgi:hypothetical protein
MHGNDQRMVADLLQRPARHPDRGLLDRKPQRFQRVDDVDIRDRAEQAAVDTGFLRDVDRRAFELGSLFLRSSELRRRGGFELCPLCLEQLDVLRRCALRLPLRDQEVAGNPCLTLTTSPRLPTLTTFSNRMICMAVSRQ